MPTDPMTRVCRDCRQPFTIGAEELAFFEQRARDDPDVPWVLPRRCTSCRMARRAARETVRVDEGDLMLRCVLCGAEFSFRSRDREFYAERSFRLPRRCPRCRSVERR